MNTTSCPFCNAPVMVPERIEGGGRIPCPRCGEAFPYRATEAVAATSAAATGTVLQAAAPPARRPSNRVIGAAVVGFMGLMAALGLTFALLTKEDRRRRDTVNPLGYLPGDCNVIAAINLTDALKQPAGQKMTGLTFRVGPVALGVADLERWTGLKQEDLNQLVLGVKLDKFSASFVLVAQTRAPYDPETVRKALGATRSDKRGPKTCYPFNLGNSVFQAALWCPSENVLVVAFTPERLGDVPDVPHSGLDHLPEPLRPLVRDPLDPGSQAWVVGHADRWDETLLGLLVKLPPEDKQTLALARTVGLWMRFENETVLVSSAAHCASAEAARTLRDYLVRKGAVAEPDAHVEKDTWVRARARTTPAAIQTMVKQAVLSLPGR